MNSDAVSAKQEQLTFFQILRLLRDVRLWRIFVLGIASGYPWVIIGGTMTNWLRGEGISRTEIGFLGLIFLAYTFNFLWAPILDAVKIRWLKGIGQRRSWILLCQIGIVAFTLVLAFTDPHLMFELSPNLSIRVLVFIALGIAIFSATQDLAIDAYRVTIIGHDEREMICLGSSMATAGWFCGAGFPGALLLYLSGAISWQWVYVAAALLVLPVTILVLKWFEEPKLVSRGLPSNWFINVLSEYAETVVDFVKRHGGSIAVGLVLFCILFKIGEAFLGRMIDNFYVDIGYTQSEIATASRLVGTFVSIACALFVGTVMPRIGVFRMLFGAGIAMAATNLIFAWIAGVGPNYDLLVFAVVADGITEGVSNAAFVAFITFYVSHLHAASQYGALASIGTGSRTALAAMSGWFLDESLGGNYTLFFILTSVAVIPSLGLLGYLAYRVRGRGLRQSELSQNVS